MAGYGTRICKDCGSEFEPYQYNQKRCYDCVLKSDPRASEKDRTKVCRCGVRFLPRTMRQVHCSSVCGEAARQDNYYIRTYGLTNAQVQEMFTKAGDRCEICGGEGFIMDNMRHKTKLAVDHDHSTGKVRGLLCHNCNRGLGLFQDSEDFLENALTYLRRNK